jgi:hypothetical protein
MEKRTLILYAIIISAIITSILIINTSLENMTPSIVKIKSGLVISEALNNENQTKEQLMANQLYWHYAGSAIVKNAPYDLYKDTQGLHIGVKAPSNGTYAGFFAVNQETKAILFHAVVSSTLRVIPSNNYFQNGLYVQTSNGLVNYVACVSVTSHDKTVWSAVSATGDTGGAKQFHVLWTDSSPNQPLTRECTVITNGQNYLKVYVDNVLAYSNNNLDLSMPYPFLTFLEVQSSYNGKPLYGTYNDFYITSNENIDVTSSLPTATTVKLVDSYGAVLASGSVVAGTASLNVGKYHFPLTANIVVYNSINAPLVSTTNPVNIFGGDVYSTIPNWSINKLSLLNP